MAKREEAPGFGIMRNPSFPTVGLAKRGLIHL
jgi:hypothetical protein